MDHTLSFDLHALTARLDRSADRLLQAEYNLSYRRFRTLLLVGELGATTQRALAERMGVTEPSVSRMAGTLAETGLLDSRLDPAGGNRRRLNLTPAGKQLVEQCRELLERRFADLVERSGVPYADYARYTKLLMAALDAAPSTDRTPL
ncbi:DNA-binding MarR family transcriptional regulator [Halopolyspora algeriensis]|uniref:DNA-binding MarR family transcriptional regulator n=1 Tax=Halopolyspora algeriensis TaxID=1500506 RepID=A0A368VXY9_9ACTN|nr:MarR family transcriptional regulator [Halopolyspora algeriensis]RCW46821.1 DNA-binding MarR family transcriptional regulator [Halopolyspora algeriensis]TQM47912.1 DNA-binding MarR family transcriptional regulator [Halopolyspora algeriensis]